MELRGSFRCAMRALGCTPQEHKQLFQKFNKLSARPTADEGSTGLGLYLVRRIAEIHGGQVGVESEYQRGSRFWPVYHLVQSLLKLLTLLTQYPCLISLRLTVYNALPPKHSGCRRRDSCPQIHFTAGAQSLPAGDALSSLQQCSSSGVDSAICTGPGAAGY